jgi:bla regulator protein blaR1
MIAWMLYTLVVSCLVVVGARAVEAIGRSIGYPVRWVWIGAMVLTISLAALAPLRSALPTRTVAPVAMNGLPIVADVAQPSWRLALYLRLELVRRELNAPIQNVVGSIERRMPKAASTYAFGIWATVTSVLVILFAGVQARYRRARRSWPIADIQGTRVRVAPNIGPVVIGMRQPEIVVPSWLLGRNADEQRLIVAHEAEHVRARDTVLLGGGCVAAALMPWNPAVWYMLSRLRLAVELDCDARVLRAGVAPRSYGVLLIEVAEKNSAFRLAAPGLADPSSHLHQRIMAMNVTKPKFALARAGAFGALGLVAMLAACEAKMPTSADIENMDAASADAAAAKLALVNSSDSIVYLVDGVRVPALKARAIPPKEIEAIEVSKTATGGGFIVIRTKAGTGQLVAKKIQLDSSEANQTKREWVASTDSGSPVRIRTPRGLTSASDKPVLFFIDGVKSDAAALKAIDRKDIASVEVLKGTAAAAYVNDPAAANGVIIVKTKRGTSQP